MVHYVYFISTEAFDKSGRVIGFYDDVITFTSNDLIPGESPYTIAVKRVKEYYKKSCIDTERLHVVSFNKL